MKLLLIQPSHLDASGRKRTYDVALMPSNALATLAALTPQGVDIRVVDDYVEDIDFDQPVDLVGITGMTSQMPRAYQIADEFRKRNRRVVMGGIHASALPQEAGRHADAVVLGEAEGLWATVIADARRGRLQSRYRADRKPDLQSLLIPRYDHFQLHKYRITHGSSYPRLPVQTTRGCPFNCDFCSVSQFWGRGIRTKPVASVCEEIAHYRRRGARNFFFSDDNIIAKPGYARQLFEAITPLEVNWSAQASTTILKDDSLVTLMAQSGCKRVFVGFESISQRNLKGMGKSFNQVAQYRDVIRLFRKAGIWVQASIIFGFDDDTPASLEATMAFLEKERVGVVHIFILTPIVGSALRDRLEAEGRIIDTDWSHYGGTHVTFMPKHFGPGDLEAFYWAKFRQIYSLRSILKRVVASRPFPLTQYAACILQNLYFRKQVIGGRHTFGG